jgi:hypothetical protein
MSEQGLQRCKNCKFWGVDTQGSSQGACHYDPPKVFLVPGKIMGNANIMSSFAPVDGNAWCSKFSADNEKITANQLASGQLVTS